MSRTSRVATGATLALVSGLTPLAVAPVPAGAANPASECTPIFGCGGVTIQCTGHLCRITTLFYGYPAPGATVYWTWSGPDGVIDTGFVTCGASPCVGEAFVGTAGGGKHKACALLFDLNGSNVPKPCATVSLK